MTRYHAALQSRRPVTTIPEGATRERIEASIAEITAALRGPMTNTERAMLVHDRADARDVLRLIVERDAAADGGQA